MLRGRVWGAPERGNGGGGGDWERGDSVGLELTALALW